MASGRRDRWGATDIDAVQEGAETDEGRQSDDVDAVWPGRRGRVVLLSGHSIALFV